MPEATLPPSAAPAPSATPGTAAPPRTRPRWDDPLLVATLVLPSVATNPALWLAVAGDAIGSPVLAAVLAVLSGLALAGVAAAVTHRWSRAGGASRAAARAHAGACLGLCAIGAPLAALSVLALGRDHLLWIAAGLAVASLVLAGGVLRRSQPVVIVALVALNVIWSIDLALLALAGADLLLGTSAA